MCQSRTKRYIHVKQEKTDFFKKIPDAVGSDSIREKNSGSSPKDCVFPLSHLSPVLSRCLFKVRWVRASPSAGCPRLEAPQPSGTLPKKP